MTLDHSEKNDAAFNAHTYFTKAVKVLKDEFEWDDDDIRKNPNVVTDYMKSVAIAEQALILQESLKDIYAVLNDISSSIITVANSIDQEDDEN